MKHAAPRRPGSAAKLGLTMLVVALLGVVAAIGTWSAFSSTTSNPGNSFTAGTVELCDDDASPENCPGGTAMFNLSGMVPGTSNTPACIKVIYRGSIVSNVRLYGATTGAVLPQYLDLKITRGTGGTTFPSCTGFTPDATEYLGAGAGAGVIYNGTLQAFPDDPPGWSGGQVDPTSGSPEAWGPPTSNETHVYKFEITLQSGAPNSAQGTNATQVFTWEARNV